jgi:hypothetical protein
MNNRWKVADGVEVYLEDVRKFVNGKYEKDEDFMPLRLHLTHWKSQRYELDIPSGTYRHCDFGFIIEPGKSAEVPA